MYHILFKKSNSYFFRETIEEKTRSPSRIYICVDMQGGGIYYAAIFQKMDRSISSHCGVVIEHKWNVVLVSWIQIKYAITSKRSLNTEDWLENLLQMKWITDQVTNNSWITGGRNNKKFEDPIIMSRDIMEREKSSQRRRRWGYYHQRLHKGGFRDDDNKTEKAAYWGGVPPPKTLKFGRETIVVQPA